MGISKAIVHALGNDVIYGADFQAHHPELDIKQYICTLKRPASSLLKLSANLKQLLEGFLLILVFDV